MTVFRKAYPEYRVRLIFIKDKRIIKKQLTNRYVSCIILTVTEIC